MAAFQIRKIQSIIVLIIVLIAILWLFKDNISKVSVFQKHTQQFDTIKEELKDITYLEKIDNFLIKEYSKEQLLLHTIEADTYYRYKNSPVKLLNIKLTQYDEIGQKKAVLTSNRAEIRKSGDIFFKDKINIQSKNGALHEINTESLIVLSNSGQIISNSEVAYLGENAIIHAQGMEMSNNDDTMSLVGDVIINQDSGAVIETVNLFVSHDDGEKIYKSTGKTFYNSNVESVEILTKSDLETLSDSELILKAIDSGIRDKIEFAGSQALDHDIPSYEKDLANREELIGVLAGLIEAKALTKSHPEKLSLEKLSDAGLTKAKLSDAVDEEQITTVNYGRNIIGNANTNQLSFAISSEDEQVVNAGEPNYVKNLETSFFSRSRGNNSKLDLGLISTNFNHKTTGKDTGIRTHGEVNFNKKLGSRLSTDTKLALSHYALDNKTNETRVVGGFDIDLSFPFSRKSTLFGSETTNQIIPRISYDFASKEKQASIPIFDTTDRIDGYLDYSSLLSGERYSSFDRVVNENDITLGLQSFYKDKLDKKTNLTFTLAQRYYGDDEVVSDTENIDFETRSKYSDIFTSAELTINDFSTYAKLQYNPKNFNLTKSRIGFNYELHPRNFITLALADDGSERDLNITGAYPISNRLHIFGGIDKTLSSGVLNKETTGVAYESCCWSARLAHFKTSAGVGYDYSTGFELVFKGLGTTDSYVRDRIKVNLPEYQVMID